MEDDIPTQHEALADRISEIIENVSDWNAPTPVAEWRARDVVEHLISWPPAMLGGLGVELPTVEIGDDPVAAWREHNDNMTKLIENGETMGRLVADERGGERPVAAVLAQYYLPDLFMHQWDLAKASGQEVGWDDEVVRGMVEGMTPAADMLAASGQFGSPKVLDESHSPTDRLIALIGRDPDWAPPAG